MIFLQGRGLSAPSLFISNAMMTIPLLFTRTILTFSLLMTITVAFGQSLSGSVVDSKNEPLIGVTVRLLSVPDSSVQRGVVTDTDGQFLFENLPVGSYRLRASFVGFLTIEQTARADTARTSPLRIVLPETARQLNEVVVKGRIVSAEQKGDTLQFNADAFKVNRAMRRPKTCSKKCPALT